MESIRLALFVFDWDHLAGKAKALRSAVKVVLQHINKEGRLTSSFVRIDRRVECFLPDPG